MIAFKEPIDYESLEGELHEAIRTDELYSLQNDAKFRAIEQSVPTYEDFRQMVNAAHLKPLDREDMTPKVGVKWNSIASDNGHSQSDKRRLKNQALDQQSTVEISSNKIPANVHEFRMVWKRLTDHSDKFQLLNVSRLALRKEIFRSEIPPDILTDCLVTCLECLKVADNETRVIDILSTISECNRFKLAVVFMSEQDKFVCEELFRALHRTATTRNEEIIDNLEKMYLM